MRIAYIVSNLKRVGPSNQTFNIINNSKYKKNSIVITLFEEPKDSMADIYIKNNIKIICLNLNKYNYIFKQKKLEKILRENNIQIIHSYGIRPDFLSYQVSKKLKIKHVITLRNYPRDDILTRMGLIKGRIALFSHLNVLKKSKNVVCCSEAIRNKMQNDYQYKKFLCIQNGVNTEKFCLISDEDKKELRKKLKLPLDKTIFISTNSFIKRKRIPELIEGFLKASRRNSILLLLGDGQLYNSLKSEYETKNIIFLGKQKNVDEYLKCSDFYISSSESEGLPNSVLEAVACRLNVILSDIEQHLEITNNIKNSGISYKLGDINDLANKIKIIEKNNKFDLLKSNFTMKKMSEKYVELYDKLWRC